MSGKQFPGQKGFPTPNDMPPDGGYVVFRIPKSNEWAGLILGAAQALAKDYNFYEWGDLSPFEAAEKFRQIVNQAPYEQCGCTYPNGSRVLRLNSTGHIEQLTDGEWTEPTDDYTIPPVPAREEPTCDERRCLAAANAANVLQQLYEEVSDAIAAGADNAEALAVLIGVAVVVIGGWLGLVLAALVTAIVGAFVGFVELAAMLGEDVWGTDFTDKLKCYLYDCASCDGDVVHFDFQCVRENMATYVDVLDINFITNLRLFGQVDFILNVIGADGLDAAGATTAITEDDCNECGNAYQWDFTVSSADWGVVAGRGSGCCFGGLGFVSVYNYGGLGNTEIRIGSPTQPAKTITRFIVEYSAEGNSDGNMYDTPSTGFAFAAPIASPGVVDETTTLDIEAGAWRLDIAIAGADAPITIKKLTIVTDNFAGLTGGSVIAI